MNPLAAGHSGALVGDRLQVTLQVEDHVYYRRGNNKKKKCPV